MVTSMTCWLRRLWPVALSMIGTPAALQASDIAALPYFDNRSSAEGVIFSAYNAINRREFSRAYSYFAKPPAASAAAYARGFDGTAMVQIATGRSRQDDGAVSLSRTVPVAIRSVARDGSESFYAGCITAGSAQSGDGTQHSAGWRIEETAIRALPGRSQMAMPDCEANGDVVLARDGTPAIPHAPQPFLPQVIALSQGHLERNQQICGPQLSVVPNSITILPKSDNGQESDPDTVLVSFVCGYGAYNELTQWLTAEHPEYVSSHVFAEPELDYELEAGPEPGTDGPVKRIGITGWKATDQLVNARWDDEPGAITTYAKWRGIGDAFTTATYSWRDGQFVLTEFAVDPSFDGRQEPVTVFPPADKR